MSLTCARAEELMARFPRCRVAVVGDLMLDRYVAGTVDRISPEAPVPVLRVNREQSVPGGASNVAMNLRAMGARAAVCGVIGRDTAGQTLEDLLHQAGVSFEGVRRAGGWPTIQKTRVMADRQQIVRVDSEKRLDFSPEELSAFAARAARAASKSDAVILEDYNKGVISQPVVDAVLKEAAKAGIPSGLDPKENEHLRVPGLTFATPNRKEAFQTAGLRDPGSAADPLRDEALRRAGLTLLKRWKPRHLAVTLGPLGMLLLTPGMKPYHVPTRAREVFDVSGAGDTVIALTALSMAAGASFLEAAELANYAAGVVVAKVGTATCTPEELRAHMRECGVI